uniref:Calcium binding protein 7 n=1 Tax=Ficedula albicollis TaxID=59894 RepID=U3JX28_FICAL
MDAGCRSGDAPSCSAHLVAPQAQAHPRDAFLGQNAAFSARAGWLRQLVTEIGYSGRVGEVGPFWAGWAGRGRWDAHGGAVGAEIREAFKVFDRDGNGFISKQELGTAMRSLGYMPNEVELEVIIQRLDMDGDGQVDFEEFVTLLGPKLSTSGIPEKFHGTDFDTVFWKCDMQKLTVDELKRLLYDTFCEHLSMKDIENIIMTEEESHMGTAEDQQIRQTCVRKSLICAFAIAFIISVMLIAANQVLRSGMK